jgi:hypothetical protein
MIRRSVRVAGAAIAVSFSLLFVACLSSAPPAPPVRWFDPSPAAAATARLEVPKRLRVEAPPHLGREFALRTGAREYAFDGEHQWIATPQELVAASLQRAVAFAPYAAEELLVRIDRFELDVTGAPRAVVALRLYTDRLLGADAIVFEAPAADRSPAALAAAMASSLGEATARVRAALQPK